MEGQGVSRKLLIGKPLSSQEAKKMENKVITVYLVETTVAKVLLKKETLRNKRQKSNRVC
jgi:hypothetical protein